MIPVNFLGYWLHSYVAVAPVYFIATKKELNPAWGENMDNMGVM